MRRLGLSVAAFRSACVSEAHAVRAFEVAAQKSVIVDVLNLSIRHHPHNIGEAIDRIGNGIAR
jgi:hypothetical protein